jgi:dienelactone hydrolase
MDSIPPAPQGTWYLNADFRGGTNKHNTLLTVTLTGSNFLIGQVTDINGQETRELLDNVSWDANTSLLEFRRSGPDSSPFWEWYRGTVVEGVFVGRYSYSQQLDSRPDLQAFRFHVTGWNSTFLDRDLVPRSYDVIIDKNRHARLRIDRFSTGELVGRLKVYAGSGGEQLEYDLQVTGWNGTQLSFIKFSSDGTQEVYSGIANGRYITSGTYTKTGGHHGGTWSGIRGGALNYGLVKKTEEEQLVWQFRTRAALSHLMMPGNPTPITYMCLPPIHPENPVPLENPQGKFRDDNPQKGPQNYQITELHFQYLLPNPYYIATIPNSCPVLDREFHGYLATPNDIAPGEKRRAVLALNGHHGSAWQMLDPGSDDIYWYGDSFARHGYVVMAVDISHRPKQDSEPLYGNGADYVGPKSSTHPSIKADGFEDSDWAEDGERAWDAMRGLDCLTSLPYVDTSKILVTGLSMGGEITTIVAALDTRLAACIPSGFSPDLDVILHRANDKTHHCWRWMHADMREYIDTSDLHALIAPRLLVVQTGKQDVTFSNFNPPFASDKQVARRSRVAYGSECHQFIHYLHYGHHFYHVGDYDPGNTHAEQGIRIPIIIDPEGTPPEDCPDSIFSATWQADTGWQKDDSTTLPIFPTLYDLLDAMLV